MKARSPTARWSCGANSAKPLVRGRSTFFMQLSRKAQSALAGYAELLRRWAPKLDLISDRDLSRLEERHLDDSLKALPLLADLPEGPAVDVGSGAGLPGVPLAIAEPARLWRLIEPRKRRAAFLEEVVRELALNCEVLTMSAEQAALDPALRATHVLGTARALAPPKAALDLVTPLVIPAGLAVVWVGKDPELPAEAEVTDSGLAIVRGDAS